MTAPPRPPAPSGLLDRLRANLPAPPFPPAPAGLRPSGVLVAVVPSASGPHLLFQRRSSRLPLHAGEICFPGGAMERGDDDLVATALREAEEETGVPRASIEILGILPGTSTVSSGYWVAPLVGLLPPSPALRSPALEVAETFLVPLALFLETGRRRTVDYEIDGRPTPVPFYDVDAATVVWGATGRILDQLLEVILRPTADR